MDTLSQAPRARRVALPERGGDMTALDFGPETRPVDIVFSHANGFNARTYRTLLAPLAGGLRILAPDLRGHGRTTLSLELEGRAGWDEMRDDLLALMAALDLKNAVLAGHSMGATVSLLAAAEAPERVRALVLAEPVIAPRSPTPEGAAGAEAMVQRALRRRAVFPSRAEAEAAYLGRGAFRTWPAVMVEDYLRDGLRERDDGQVELACSPEWEASNFRAHRNRSREALARFGKPVHILRGQIGSTADVEGLAETAVLTVETIPHTSHFLPMERPELVREALLAAAS